MAKEYKDLVVGLDIGTAKVMVVVAEVMPGGELKLAGLGVAPSNGLKRGVVVNIDATVQSIQQALKEAELMADCKITRVYTGIIFVPKVVERTPPYIEEVEPGSPAEKIGLKPDDLVIYFDGEPIYSLDVFTELVRRYQPGEKVQIEIRRGDKLTALTMELAPLPKK